MAKETIDLPEILAVLAGIKSLATYMDDKVPGDLLIACAETCPDLERIAQKADKIYEEAALMFADKADGKPVKKPFLKDGMPQYNPYTGQPVEEIVITEREAEWLQKREELMAKTYEVSFSKIKKEQLKGFNPVPGKIANYLLLLRYFVTK